MFTTFIRDICNDTERYPEEQPDFDIMGRPGSSEEEWDEAVCVLLLPPSFRRMWMWALTRPPPPPPLPYVLSTSQQPLKQMSLVRDVAPRCSHETD